MDSRIKNAIEELINSDFRNQVKFDSGFPDQDFEFDIYISNYHTCNVWHNVLSFSFDYTKPEHIDDITYLKIGGNVLNFKGVRISKSINQNACENEYLDESNELTGKVYDHYKKLIESNFCNTQYYTLHRDLEEYQVNSNEFDADQWIKERKENR